MNPSSQKNVNSSDYVGSWWEKSIPKIEYLHQEIFIKTKRGRAYDKAHEKKKLAHKCIICNEKFSLKQRT